MTIHLLFSVSLSPSLPLSLTLSLPPSYSLSLSLPLSLSPSIYIGSRATATNANAAGSTTPGGEDVFDRLSRLTTASLSAEHDPPLPPPIPFSGGSIIPDPPPKSSLSPKPMRHRTEYVVPVEALPSKSPLRSRRISGGGTGSVSSTSTSTTPPHNVQQQQQQQHSAGGSRTPVSAAANSNTRSPINVAAGKRPSGIPVHVSYSKSPVSAGDGGSDLSTNKSGEQDERHHPSSSINGGVIAVSGDVNNYAAMSSPKTDKAEEDADPTFG